MTIANELIRLHIGQPTDKRLSSAEVDEIIERNNNALHEIYLRTGDRGVLSWVEDELSQSPDQEELLLSSTFRALAIGIKSDRHSCGVHMDACWALLVKYPANQHLLWRHYNSLKGNAWSFTKTDLMNGVVPRASRHLINCVLSYNTDQFEPAFRANYLYFDGLPRGDIYDKAHKALEDFIGLSEGNIKFLQASAEDALNDSKKGNMAGPNRNTLLNRLFQDSPSRNQLANKQVEAVHKAILELHDPAKKKSGSVLHEAEDPRIDLGVLTIRLDLIRMLLGREPAEHETPAMKSHTPVALYEHFFKSIRSMINFDDSMHIWMLNIFLPGTYGDHYTLKSDNKVVEACMTKPFNTTNKKRQTTVSGILRSAGADEIIRVANGDSAMLVEAFKATGFKDLVRHMATKNGTNAWVLHLACKEKPSHCDWAYPLLGASWHY